MDQYIGKVLDNRYEILEIIGVGGMAVVYKGLDLMLDRHVAIKVLKDEFVNDADFRKRFANESHAVARLSHNNIVSVYDVSRSEMPQYIVMELIEGITLKEYLNKKGTLTWQETLFFIQQIAKALEHAHSRGIIHQDIKPHNICLLRDGTAKVTDFGIARFEKKQETQVIEQAIGSVHYISPEQAKGSAIDHRADLYSLGIMMYEMLTGQVPFDGETPLAIVMQHLNAIVPPPSERVNGIPKGMDDIVMRAMHPTLNKRYENATQIYNDLEQLKKQPTIRFDTTVSRQATVDGETMVMGTLNKEIRREQERQTGTGTEPIHISIPSEPEAPPERPRKRSFWGRLVESPLAMAMLGVLVCVVIAVVAMGKLMGFGAELLVVPNFVGDTLAEVQSNQTYTEQFVFQEATKRVVNNEVEPGTILQQSPAAGDNAKAGSVIVLTLSEQKETESVEPVTYTLEDFTKKSINYVDIVLTNRGISYRLEPEASLEVNKDAVIRTEPAAGTVLTSEDEVLVYVSSGAEGIQVPVPNMIGSTLSEAQQMLRDVKLAVNVEGKNSDAPINEVIEQSVDADTKVDVGTAITIVFSLGESTKPETPVVPNRPQVNDPVQPPTQKEEPSNPVTPPPAEQEDPEQSGMGEAAIHFRLPGDVDSAHVTIRLEEGELVYEQTYDPTLYQEDTYICTAPVGTHRITIEINGAQEVRTVEFK